VAHVLGVGYDLGAVAAMTTTLDVTDEQRRQIGAHSACVVEGMVQPCMIPNCGDLRSPDHPLTYSVPQPWLDVTKTCETCGGTGDTCRGDDLWPVPCSNCRNGQPIMELRAPVRYDMLDNAWVGDQRRVDLDHVGPESKRKMWVSLGRYTVELAPVVTGGPTEWPRQTIVWLYPSGQMLLLDYTGDAYRRRESPYNMTDWFDPLPVPGRDMVAVLTKINDERKEL
jgi:hypothetical protein